MENGGMIEEFHEYRYAFALEFLAGSVKKRKNKPKSPSKSMKKSSSRPKRTRVAPEFVFGEEMNTDDDTEFLVEYSEPENPFKQEATDCENDKHVVEIEEFPLVSNANSAEEMSATAKATSELDMWLCGVKETLMVS